MKILVADDSPVSQKILQAQLTKWGYESIVVGDGAAAWHVLQQPDAPQLVIIDWMMPEMDGVEVCRRVREAKREPYIYIILLTGRDERADIVRGLDAGADDYIVKPFDIHELDVRLRAGKRIVDLQSELIAAREQLRVEASTDPLTGLLNRNAIFKVMHRDALRAKREGTHLAVALLDIDHFKKVNDTYGHKAGDHVLRHVADCMAGLLRPYDALARFGGEEFLLFLPNCSRADAVHVADRLASPRDFLAPVAAYENREGDFHITAKFLGRLWSAVIDHSPLDVVAWHGNYAPYKYDLALFNCINTVSFDHPDPSIYTVLTSPSNTAGTTNCDFAIFPPRWVVAEHTFRPPWFHRNLMNEFMGLVFGAYDAKAEGFVPGGASLHNCMAGHGPDAETFERASNADLKPQYLDNTLAFMFETQLVVRPTEFAMNSRILQHEYFECWQPLKKHFKPEAK